MTAALLAALIAVGWRLLKRRLDRTRNASVAAQLPGLSPDKAIGAPSFGEMDDVLRRFPCPRCGGSLISMGEGTQHHHGRELRVVRLECLRCEEPCRLYFDLEAVVH